MALVEPDRGNVAGERAENEVCDAGRHLPSLLARDPAARVVVVGARSPRHLLTASVSLYAGLSARALGARDVTLVDARPAVRAQAADLGLAAVTPRQARRLSPAPLIADVSASPAGLRLPLELTAPDGRCSSSGSLHTTSRIPTTLMFGRNATLTVSRTHARAVIPAVLDLVRTHRLAPERVTTVLAGLDDAREALSERVRGGSTKTVLAERTY